MRVGSIELDTVITLIALVIGIHTCLTSLQHLSVRDRFAEGGIVSWRIAHENVRTTGPFAVVLQPLFRPPRFTGLLVVRLVTAIGLIVFALFSVVPAVIVGLLFLSNVLIGTRHHVGLSGDFHMSTVTYGGLLVAAAAPAGSALELAGVLFIAAQSILSYAIAGVAKLVSPVWWNGSGIRSIFSTDAWGNKYVYEAFERIPTLSVLAGVTVIAFESLFVTVLFVRPAVAVGILGVGFLFHLFNAVFMGLNGFLVAWTATYPAVYYASQLVPYTVI